MPDIPRKPKKQSPPEIGESNGPNGEKHAAEATAASNDLKRPRTDDGEAPQAKKVKTTAGGNDNEDCVVVVEEGADGGAIVIDD